MFHLNLPQLLSNRGIDRHGAFLVKHGFTQYTASRLLTIQVSNINTKHKEKLCTALNCTIDDLFVWIPGKDVTDADNHPLQKLIAKPNEFYVGDRLKKLSPQKLEAVKEFLKGLELNT